MSPIKQARSKGIVSWPQEERPRERLLSKGAQALTDAELFAILIRVGLKGTSAVELGRDLLKQFGSLRAMVEAPVIALLDVKGLKGELSVNAMFLLNTSHRQDESCSAAELRRGSKTVFYAPGCEATLVDDQREFFREASRNWCGDLAPRLNAGDSFAGYLLTGRRCARAGYKPDSSGLMAVFSRISKKHAGDRRPIST